MNNTNQKQYLVIKNVGTDTYLRHYLEKICEENHVQIITEYINNNWFEEPKPSLYAEFNAKPMFDALLCSYDNNKLLYIKYLYDKYDRLASSIENAIMNVQNSKTEEEIEEEKLIKEIEDQIDSSSYVSWAGFLSKDGGISWEKVENNKEETRQVLKNLCGADWTLMNNSVKIYNLEPEKISVKDKIINWYNKHKNLVKNILCAILGINMGLWIGVILTIILNVVK